MCMGTFYPMVVFLRTRGWNDANIVVAQAISFVEKQCKAVHLLTYLTKAC